MICDNELHYESFELNLTLVSVDLFRRAFVVTDGNKTVRIKTLLDKEIGPGYKGWPREVATTALEFDTYPESYASTFSRFILMRPVRAYYTNYYGFLNAQKESVNFTGVDFKCKEDNKSLLLVGISYKDNNDKNPQGQFITSEVLLRLRSDFEECIV